MDPDKPNEDDPPIDALSMLEVIGDNRASAEARMAAARQMMAPYAIRAILDGVDPRVVAEACGFRIDGSKSVQVSPMEVFISQAFGQRVVFETDDMGGMGVDDGLSEFTQWITRKLAEMIQEKA